MLSRVAENFFWMGRYVERACNIARFLEVNYYLSLDLDKKYVQWAPMLQVTGDFNEYLQRNTNFEALSVMKFLILDKQYINSAISAITLARENARGTRETIPVEFWEELNSLWKLLNQHTEREDVDSATIRQLCSEVKACGTFLQGICEDTMWHGESFQFYKMGLWLERADKTSRFLHTKYFFLLPSLEDVGTILDDLHWTALLQSLHGIDIYHRNYGLISPDKVINFLLMDEQFPRSVLFCLNHALGCLGAIQDSSLRTSSKSKLKDLVTHISAQNAPGIISDGLHEFIDDFQIRLNAVTEEIKLHFF
jgi:uncharacterized alpha-E superfamily protein